MSDEEKLLKQMIDASYEGDEESLNLILSAVDNKNEFVQLVDEDGETALHRAGNQEMAKLLVETVELSQRRAFILAGGTWGTAHTALASAVNDDRVDVAEYLCSLIPADEVLDTPPYPDYTPLHEASSDHLAKLLVESVPEGRRLPFLLFPHGEGGGTALHEAVENDRVEVVQYLCSLNISEFVLCKDNNGETALHLACSETVAKLLIESLPDSLRKDFILAVNRRGNTALHSGCSVSMAKLLIEALPDSLRKDFIIAVNDKGRTVIHEAAHRYVDGNNLVEILNIWSKIPKERESIAMKQDHDGKTPLHDARSVEIARALINQVQDKSAYVNMTDNEGQTALYTANDSKIAELLIEDAEDKSGYVKIKDRHGRTALHYANDKQVMEVLLDHVEDKLAYLSQRDCNGETALPVVSNLPENVSRYKAWANFVEIQYEQMWPGFENAILSTDNLGQNFLHVAAMDARLFLGEPEVLTSDPIGQFTEFLEDNNKLARKLLPKMLAPDNFGNTPLHYLAARFRTQTFYRLCMLIPLWMRRTLMTQRREDGLTCLSILGQKERAIEYFMRDVLAGRTPKPYVIFGNVGVTDPPGGNLCLLNDINLFKVMKCVLNEYPLLYGHQLLMWKFKQWQRFQPVAEEVVGPVEPLWFYFDARELSWQDMQNRLYEIDTEKHQGEPKVVVVTGYTSTPDKYLSPPGPDCIIISIIGDISSGDLLQLQTTHYAQPTDINEFLRCAQNMNGVQFLNVNSTMRRHYGSSTKVDTDYTLVNDGCRGKAMIICHKTGRGQWEIEYDHAVNVLEKQLGLEVVKPSYDHDMSSEELEREIEKFSKLCVQSSLVVVCIMSHGDEEGNIICKDPKDVITVQKIADAFCKHLHSHVTKLLFLSFCRGPLGRPRHNRTFKSWEDTFLPELSDFCNVVRQDVDPRKLEDARKTHPFPSVNMPPNCYILYSTLPDSKSFRYNGRTGEANKMFEEMSSFLTDFHTRHPQTHDPKTHSCHDQGARDSQPLPLAVKDDQRSDSSSVDGTASAPHVELIYLFTEVASRVKEESQATQVLNFCYALDKESKPVHVELPL